MGAAVRRPEQRQQQRLHGPRRTHAGKTVPSPTKAKHWGVGNGTTSSENTTTANGTDSHQVSRRGAHSTASGKAGNEVHPVVTYDVKRNRGSGASCKGRKGRSGGSRA